MLNSNHWSEEDSVSLVTDKLSKGGNLYNYPSTAIFEPTVEIK